jgi:monofunctional biosynthetic peptidoglycan transglycosylase
MTKRKRKLLQRIARGAGMAALVFVLLSSSGVVALRWMAPPTTAFMLLDSSGRERLEYRWVDAEQIGPSLPYAVIAAEDQKFPEHFGFDLESIRESLGAHGDGEPLRGASTITQQVAKNLFLWSGRSFVRKGLEAYFTVLLEVFLTKDRILEIYLNVAEFGPGIYGVEAAGDIYFAKSAARVSDAEAALLAATLPAPKTLSAARPSAYVRERQQWILTQMRRLEREGALASLEMAAGR